MTLNDILAAEQSANTAKRVAQSMMAGATVMAGLRAACDILAEVRHYAVTIQDLTNMQDESAQTRLRIVEQAKHRLLTFIQP